MQFLCLTGKMNEDADAIAVLVDKNIFCARRGSLVIRFCEGSVCEAAAASLLPTNLTIRASDIKSCSLRPQHLMPRNVHAGAEGANPPYTRRRRSHTNNAASEHIICIARRQESTTQ
jgi:hypothetical protein